MIYSQTKALSSCRPTPLYLILGDFSSPCLRPCNCTIEIVTACKTSHFSTIASFHREHLWLIHVKVIIMLFVLKIQLPRVWWGTPITRDWDRKIAIAVSSRPACSTWRRLISLGWRMELLLKNSYILVFHVWCIYSIDANAHKCIFFFKCPTIAMQSDSFFFKRRFKRKLTVAEQDLKQNVKSLKINTCYIFICRQRTGPAPGICSGWSTASGWWKSPRSRLGVSLCDLRL